MIDCAWFVFEIEKGVQRTKDDLAKAKRGLHKAEIETWRSLSGHNTPVAGPYTYTESKAAMTKPEHTRPFSMTDAKAGAPYCCRDGQEATVLKWDLKAKIFKLVGIWGELESVSTWTEQGHLLYGDDKHARDLVMLPLGMIDSKPVFVGDEIVFAIGRGRAIPTARDFSGCTWPAPARQYPVTGMSAMDLEREYAGDHPYGDGLQDVANAALRHAIDADTVRITEEVKARDLVIAEKAYLRGFSDARLNHLEFLDEKLFAALISEVKG